MVCYGVSPVSLFILFLSLFYCDISLSFPYYYSVSFLTMVYSFFLTFNCTTYYGILWLILAYPCLLRRFVIYFIFILIYVLIFLYLF